MWSKLVSILNSLSKGTLKNILTGAGLMLTTNIVVFSTFQTAVSTLRSSVNSVSVEVLALAHLAGFDIAMSLILGAIVTRMTMSSSKLILKKSA